ncbi:MAG: winged helix-turn-helix transcriptional regulator [Spirochaetales bacterium]|nr:winged helix-turn-helix transcriptional regulator [Spirochaetales bacterium]
MYRTIQKFKALGDENRFRILMMLLQKPLCVCELLEVLDIKGGTLSAHLKLLKNAGLINQEKDGRWVVYSISSEETKLFLTEIMENLKENKIIRKDKVIVSKISRDICSRSVKL